MGRAGVRWVWPRRRILQPGRDGAALCWGSGTVQRFPASRRSLVRLQVQHSRVKKYCNLEYDSSNSVELLLIINKSA